MKKTLYVSDLDGTLLNSEAKLNQKTITIINDLIEQGMLFAYATARSYTSANNITKSLNLRIPIISHNGTFLIEPSNGKIVDMCELENIEKIIEIIKSAKIYPLVYAMFDGEEKVSWVEGKETEGIKKYIKTRAGDKRLRTVKNYDDLFGGNIFYITIIGKHDQTIGIEHHFDNGINYAVQEDTYTKDEYWLEILSHEASKKNSVEKLKKLVGADEIVCFGDNINDISMFTIANRCYAMQNAHCEVKNIATEVIGSNDDDGVALKLQSDFKAIL